MSLINIALTNSTESLVSIEYATAYLQDMQINQWAIYLLYPIQSQKSWNAGKIHAFGWAYSDDLWPFVDGEISFNYSTSCASSSIGM